MVSKRQKLARKRYKEANPQLFATPEPRPLRDPSKIKKKRSGNFKRNKLKPSDTSKPKRNSYTKHPLRVSGMRPGESCYICKEPDHAAKNCPKKSEWERNKVCLLCRIRGHSLKNCPNKNDSLSDQKLCYNCGERGHSLANCLQPLEDGGTKYANCFVCNESGHLSKNCPKNTRGIYPKGGCCKICGGVTHLAKDCPNKNSPTFNVANRLDHSSEIHERPNRITRFVSGDDLEDDFTAIGDDQSKSVKANKGQGAKVVNFLG